jgi:hypothetical protein
VSEQLDRSYKKIKGLVPINSQEGQPCAQNKRRVIPVLRL